MHTHADPREVSDDLEAAARPVSTKAVLFEISAITRYVFLPGAARCFGCWPSPLARSARKNVRSHASHVLAHVSCHVTTLQRGGSLSVDLRVTRQSSVSARTVLVL